MASRNSRRPAAPVTDPIEPLLDVAKAAFLL